MTVLKNAAFLLVEFTVAMAISLGVTWLMLYAIACAWDL